MDPLTTLWFAEWIRRVEEEEQNWLEDVLGTRWTKEYFDAVSRGGPSVRPKEVRVPLTLALAQSDFLKEVKKMIGTSGANMPGSVPDGLAGTEVEEIGTWSKEDFLALIGGAGLFPNKKSRTTKKAE